MRSRGEIEKEMYDTTHYNSSGLVTYTDEDGQKRLVMEVLLDIRDLLTRQTKPQIQHPEPPQVKVSLK